MRRSRWFVRLILLVVCLLGLSVAIPVGQPVPVSGSRFPLAALWSVITTRAAWAFGQPPTPAQGRGGALALGSEATRAGGGTGRPSEALHGQETPQPPDVAEHTTGKVTTGFDAVTSRRIAAESSERVDVFANADGSKTRRTYAGRVNFRDANGAWQPFDSRLTHDSLGRLRPAAHDMTVTLAGSATARQAPGLEADLVSITFPSGESAGWGLSGAAPVQPTVDGGYATYRGVLPATDVELLVLPSMVKETLVLHSAAAPSSWVFPLRLSGLTLRKEAGGSVSMLDSRGERLAVIPHGYMEDSASGPAGHPRRSDAVEYEIITLPGERQALRVTADAAWLNDPARVYPVRVDPTAEVGAGASTFVLYPFTQDRSDSLVLSMGYHTNPDPPELKAESFVKFDGLSGVGARVTSASLSFNLVWAGSCPTPRTFSIGVYDIASSWTPSSVTNWDNQPTYGQMVGGSTGAAASAVCANTAQRFDRGSRWGIDLTTDTGLAMLNRWTTGGANNGIVIYSPTTPNNDNWHKISSALTGSYSRPWTLTTSSMNFRVSTGSFRPTVFRRRPPPPNSSWTPSIRTSGPDR